MEKLNELISKACLASELGKKGITVDLQMLTQIRGGFWKMEKRAEAAESNYANERYARKQVEKNYGLLEAKLAVMCDRQYIAGLQAGFRLGDAGDNEGLNKATANYRKQIIEEAK